MIIPSTQTPTLETIDPRRSDLIVSASGWRKVFAADGGEESSSPALSPEDAGLVAAIAEAYHRYLAEPGLVILGTDSRPTGREIADTAARVLLARGHEVVFTGICAIPELIAYTASRSNTAGFFYVSASHNPLGYNGIKFGGPDGSVLQAGESRRIAGHFEEILTDAEALREAAEATGRVPDGRLEALYDGAVAVKKAAAAAYGVFVLRTAADAEEIPALESFREAFREALRADPLGIVIDFNGSARSVSIDRSFFEDLGATVHGMHEQPGEVAHQIVPEGAGLEPCARELESRHEEDPSFMLGYVPDNDGDRGNLLFFDETEGRARSIHAQAVFAMACLAELLWLRAAGRVAVDEAGHFAEPVAIVANGPTSLRVDALATAFGAEVHRAEVGEANVVGLARTLRGEGYTVRILGEGSNGGNITHPGVVRDPVQTLLAALKLTRLREAQSGLALLRWWQSSRGAPAGDGDPGDPGTPAPESFPTLREVLAALPAWTTTSAYEDRALLRIRSRNHGELKRRYEEIFTEEWERRRQELSSSYGIRSWREINYEGLEAREGGGPVVRSGAQTGGLKIVFADAEGSDCAFIWMRGSGTEPVFRVLVDVRGTDKAFHDDLLAWHTDMVRRADARAGESA